MWWNIYIHNVKKNIVPEIFWTKTNLTFENKVYLHDLGVNYKIKKQKKEKTTKNL